MEDRAFAKSKKKDKISHDETIPAEILSPFILLYFFIYLFFYITYTLYNNNLNMSTLQVSGKLTNLGNDVTFFVSSADSVTFSLGPLPYVYKLSQIKFHFGRKDGMGTEHSIDGKQFDAEV